MFENEIMNLVDAPMRKGDSTTLRRTETYYVYGIQIDGSFKVDIHVPGFCKHSIWSHTALYGEEVHVHVGTVGSIINYTAIVDRATLADMLKEHGHDPDTTALWRLVLKYECL